MCSINISLFFSFFYALLRWNAPCNLATFAYFSIPACADYASIHSAWTPTSITILLLICFITFYLGMDGIGSLTLAMIDFSLAQAYCLRRYVQHAYRFALYKNDISLGLRQYRKVQVLACYYNSVQQNLLIILYLFLEMATVVLGFYTSLSSITNVSIMKRLLFLGCALNSATGLMLYLTFMGKLHSTSKSFIIGVKSRLLSKVKYFRDRRWSKRYVKSLRLLKCYLGNVNFVDELTPFVFINFCIDGTINLLLLNQ